MAELSGCGVCRVSCGVTFSIVAPQSDIRGQVAGAVMCELFRIVWFDHSATSCHITVGPSSPARLRGRFGAFARECLKILWFALRSGGLRGRASGAYRQADARRQCVGDIPGASARM